MRRYRIGRAETNDVVLPEATVSREHAELTELGGGRFSIKDLGSTYGTSIRRGQDWDKIGEAELQHDTPLRLGEYQTTVAGLLRDTDRTMVHAKAPAPAPPSPPKPRAPQSAPAAKSAPAAGSAAPPRPAAPALPWRDLPPEKRTLMWLLVGLGAFLLVSLITLVVVLAVGGGGDRRTGRLDRPRADAPRAGYFARLNFYDVAFAEYAHSIELDAKVVAALETMAELDPVGELTLKGFQRPVRAFNLRALRGVDAPGAAPLAAPAPG